MECRSCALHSLMIWVSRTDSRRLACRASDIRFRACPEQPGYQSATKLSAAVSNFDNPTARKCICLRLADGSCLCGNGHGPRISIALIPLPRHEPSTVTLSTLRPAAVLSVATRESMPSANAPTPQLSEGYAVGAPSLHKDICVSVTISTYTSASISSCSNDSPFSLY